MWGKKNILVVGDAMLDTYYTGSVNRISPEAPVPVFKKTGERSVLGGAANVAANLVAAGQNVSIMAVIGNDEPGKEIQQLFAQKRIDTGLLDVGSKETITKIRFLADNNQQVLRLDIEDTDEISSVLCANLLSRLGKKLDLFDMIVLSDYMKGLLTYEFTQGVIRLGNQSGIRVLVDVKDPDHSKYHGAFLLKPNLKELNLLTKQPVDSFDNIIKASSFLRENAGCEYVLTTCGARGMVLTGESEAHRLDTVGKSVYDVTGAGDTTIAYLAAALANGMDILSAMELANYAAGIQVGKVGTSAVYIQEVREVMERGSSSYLRKKLRWRNLDEFIQRHSGDKIVFTNGCFDILHVGHKRYLEEASRLGDILVVGVNSDASVTRLKGPGRPVNTERDRVELLTAMDFVDYVIVFEDDTPFDLIQRIQPDILVKGGDYRPEDVVGKDIVEKKGGNVVILPFVDGKSTTSIITKIKEE